MFNVTKKKKTHKIEKRKHTRTHTCIERKKKKKHTDIVYEIFSKKYPHSMIV